MKKIIISLAIVFSSLSIFSQSLIEFSSRKAYVNGSNLDLFAYKTHFKSSTNLSIMLVKQNDTVKIYNPYIYDEEALNFYISSFPSSGSYDLYVSNSIDSVMYLPNAVEVFSNSAYVDYELKDYSCNSGVDTSLIININNSNIISAGVDTAYFINSNDTIWPDSVLVLSNDSLQLDVRIPNDAVGFYDFVISNSIDSTILSLSFLKVMNSSLTQIADVNPDSIDNVTVGPGPWGAQLISVYGNNTHFLSDSNVVYVSGYYSSSDIIDSIKVIDDSLLTFNILLPMPIKNAANPNTTLTVYNSIDGILRFPIEIVLYGSIGERNKGFNKIECYPNPSSDFITISSEDFANEKSLSVEIFTIDGRKVQSELSHNKSSITIDIHNLAKGIYITKVSGKEKTSSFKFVIQ
jgi:hypothetical protein